MAGISVRVQVKISGWSLKIKRNADKTGLSEAVAAEIPRNRLKPLVSMENLLSMSLNRLTRNDFIQSR